jgi:hypothetical protein
VPTSIHQHGNQRSNERLSLTVTKPSVVEHDRVKLSATASLLRLPRPLRPLGSTTPPTCLLSEHDSAWFTDSNSPVLASPGCAAMLEEELLDPCSITAVRRVLGRNPDRDVPLCFPSCKHQPTDAPTTYPPNSYISHYHTSIHPPLVRPIRDPIHLPSITREGRIVPLKEDYESGGTNYVGKSPPLVDDPEFFQVLLQPVQCFGHTLSPVGKHPQVSLPTQ